MDAKKALIRAEDMKKGCFFYYRAATKRRTAQRQHSSQRSSLIITEQRRMNMSKLTYIRCGDYDIPNLNFLRSRKLLSASTAG